MVEEEEYEVDVDAHEGSEEEGTCTFSLFFVCYADRFFASGLSVFSAKT